MTDREICDWVVETCVSFGATISTAYIVAGLFIAGIQQTREPPLPMEAK